MRFSTQRLQYRKENIQIADLDGHVEEATNPEGDLTVVTYCLAMFHSA